MAGSEWPLTVPAHRAAAKADGRGGITRDTDCNGLAFISQILFVIVFGRYFYPCDSKNFIF